MRPRARKFTNWLTTAAAALIVLLLAGGAWWWFRPVEPASAEPSLAVLPFTNMSGDPAQNYLGAGIAEDIITMLSTFPTLRVVSRMSRFTYDKPVRVQQVGQELGVRYVLEGSVRKAADNVRITAQLINAETGDHVWASRFDQESADVVALQEDVANRIYDSLAGFSGEIQQNQQQDAWRKAAPGLAEYDYYLRGHQLFAQVNREDNARARQIWQEGLTRFPDAALLRNKLAWTYLRDVWVWQSSEPERDLQQAWKPGREVEAAQNKSRLATWLNHWLMAWLYQWREGDFVRSVAKAETTLQMVPYDAFSLADLANVVANAGRTDLAIEWAKDANRRDPECPEWMCVWSLAWAYYLAARPEDALAELQKMSQPVRSVLSIEETTQRGVSRRPSQGRDAGTLGVPESRGVDFFYGLGSRYSYLASTQIAQLEANTGCRVRWRPLYSADLFAARGLDPFKGQPASGQYDWAYRRRDAERWADYYGVPYREPEGVRFDPRRLALACTVAAPLGAVEPFSRRLFQALFVDGTSPLDDGVCITLAREIGLDEGAFRAALGHPETAADLAATVKEAAARGLFGVPSFVVGDEVYFGNDRLPLVRHALLQDRDNGP